MPDIDALLDKLERYVADKKSHIKENVITIKVMKGNPSGINTTRFKP
jgi:hypothetical protein